jgi:hypothetical protein
MSGSDRPRRVRGLAQTLSTRTQTDVRATYDNGARWYLEWTDGPTVAEVRAAVVATDLAGAEIRTYRTVSARAVATGAIRLAAAGELTIGRRWSQPLDQVRDALDDVAHPDRPRDQREDRMAARLLDAATPTDQQWPAPNEYRIADLVAERGLAWLLPDGAAAPADQQPGLTPIEVLTARYAAGPAARAWREQAQTMPLRAAVEAALADPVLDADAAVAMVALLPQLRAEQEHLEAAAVDAARRAGTSWAQVGAALGISKQSAHTWARRRSTGARSRASVRA